MEPGLFDAFIRGLASIFVWQTFAFMLIGIAVGFMVGILPGLGGPVTLAIMLPFTFDMQPVEAFAFLLGMSAVADTTGDITSILFGVPGESTSAAAVMDGHAMAKRGEAGRALGAALMSSLIGAVIGAFTLALSIPIVRPLVLSFGTPEFFMLAVLGICFVGSLSTGGTLKGLIAGGLGLLLATIGMDPQSGMQRYTLGQLHFWDGIGLVPVTTGLFAIPEIVDLAIKGTSIADQRVGKIGGVWQGVKDSFRHFGLTFRCSAIGTFIGIMPAIGGSVAQWMAYAHAVQTCPPRDRFGKGAVEGVLAPASANNSVLGGALVPTVAFGIPGSLVMAILLGAFIIQGLVPGKVMLTEKLDLTMSFVWVIVVSNVITVSICFLFLQQIARITFIRGGLLIAPIILLVYVGSFAEKNALMDLTTTLVFGGIGLVMAQLGWPRPPLVLGLVLGGLAESNLFLANSIHGTDWLTRPIVMVTFVLAACAVAYSALASRRTVAERAAAAPRQDLPSRRGGLSWRMLFTVVLLVVVAAAIWQAQAWTIRARLFPWVIAFPVLAMLLLQLGLELTGWLAGPAASDEAGDRLAWHDGDVRRRFGVIVGWLLGLGLAVWALGFPIGGTLGTLAYLKLSARERWPISLAITAGTAVFFWLMGHQLEHPVPARSAARPVRSVSD